MNIGHCFGGDTLILVDLGNGQGPHDEKIADLFKVGKEFKVLCEDGNWHPAVIEDCGAQYACGMSLTNASYEVVLDVVTTQTQWWPVGEYVSGNPGSKLVGQLSLDLMKEHSSHPGIHFFKKEVKDGKINKDREPIPYGKEFYVGRQGAPSIFIRFTVDFKPPLILMQTYCVKIISNTSYFVLGGSRTWNAPSGVLTGSCKMEVDLDEEYGNHRSRSLGRSLGDEDEDEEAKRKRREKERGRGR